MDEGKSLIPNFSPASVIPAPDENYGLTSEENFASAMVSARGIIEGWLFKTSQNLTFFSMEAFHRRYYRLNLMTEELKIFEKPDGALK